jgi:hypothetical protein
MSDVNTKAATDYLVASVPSRSASSRPMACARVASGLRKKVHHPWLGGPRRLTMRLRHRPARPQKAGLDQCHSKPDGRVACVSTNRSFSVE